MTEPNPAASEGGLQPRKQSLFRSSALMASGTMVSRVLGFLRTALLIMVLGTSTDIFEAFQVSNTLPNTVYNLLASGILDAVLIPQIIRALRTKAGTVYVNRLLTAAGSILFVLTLVTMVAAPLLVTLFAPKFDGPSRTLAIAFSLVFLPQLFFYGLYNLWGEVLNARGIFGPYMWAPVVNNVVGIFGLVLFLVLWGTSTTTFPAESFTTTQFLILAGTTTLGVVLQAVILLVPLRKSGVKLRLDFRFKGTNFGSATKVAGWTFATLLVSQVGVISTFQLGSRAWGWGELNDIAVASMGSYNTAFMIYMVPQSLIAVTLSTAIFTRLANSVANSDQRAVAKDYHTGTRLITMLSMAAAAILMVGAVPIMQVITFTHGPESASIYGSVLVALAMGIPSTGIILISQRVFFAYENAKPVFLMGIVPTILQVIVGWGVFFIFSDSGNVWMIGAAAGETVCRIVQGFIAIIWTAHLVRTINAGKVIASYVRYLFAFVVAALPAWGVLHLVSPDTQAETSLGRLADALWKVGLVAVIVLLIFFFVLKYVDPDSFASVKQAVQSRLPGRFRKVVPETPVADPVVPVARTDQSAAPSWDDIVISEEASRTLARAMGAIDPTSTGQIPVIRSRAMAPLPTFDELMAEEGLVDPATARSLTEESDPISWVTAPTLANTGYDSTQAPRVAEAPNKDPERMIGLDNAATGGVTDPSSGKGRFNPTLPALIIGFMVVGFGAYFAISTVLSPIDLDLDASPVRSDSTQSGSGPETSEPPAPAVVEPVIADISVLSWNDDDLDHPELASALTDGDPETLWYTRYYDLNQFEDESTIALLVKLESEALVTEITLDVIGDGGEVIVRAAENGNPRVGPVLATVSLHGQTVIRLAQPTKLSELGLSFKSLPTDDEGLARAKVSQLTIR